MNQLEISAQDSQLTTDTKSASNMSLSVSSLAAHVQDVKRRDSPEVDREDDERSQQEVDNGHEDDNIGEVNEISEEVGDLMVSYDGFESVGKSFVMPRFSDEDQDVVNIRSPILCKSLTSSVRSASRSPTCVSALARDEVTQSNAVLNDPSWTIQEFQEYLSMLELLQDVSSDAKGEEMCLSVDCLDQMERLLTSLLPQRV